MTASSKIPNLIMLREQKSQFVIMRHMDRQSYWMRQKSFRRWLTLRYHTSSVQGSEILDCDEETPKKNTTGSGFEI